MKEVKNDYSSEDEASRSDDPFISKFYVSVSLFTMYDIAVVE